MTLERTRYLRELRTRIDQHFSLDEIQLLCFDLGVDYEHLSGQTKPIKAHGLIMYLAQRARLDALLQLVEAQRPGIDWPDIPPAAQQVEDEQSLQLVKFRDPLLRAIFDLQSRIYNIVQGFFLKIYYHKSDEDREYAVHSTLFNVGEYLGWVEIMRRDGQFLDLGDVSSNRGIEELLRKVAKTFARDDLDNAFRIFHVEQRAIGEVMIVQDAAGTSAQPRCIGYAEFVERMDDPAFRRWFARLSADVERIATEHKQHEERLIMLHNVLIDLIAFLDPRFEHISEKYRERLPMPDAV
jgi:hypothetical protein